LVNILKLIFFLVERGRGAFVTFMISLRRIQMFLLTYLLTYNICMLADSATASCLHGSSFSKIQCQPFVLTSYILFIKTNNKFTLGLCCRLLIVSQLSLNVVVSDSALLWRFGYVIVGQGCSCTCIR